MPSKSPAKPKRRGNTIPPRRTVPKGANRGPRNLTLGCAVSVEEKQAFREMAAVMGFKTASSFLSWIVENIHQMSRHPVHGMAFEADLVAKVSAAEARMVAAAAAEKGYQEKAPYSPVLDVAFFTKLGTEIGEKFDQSLAKSFEAKASDPKLSGSAEHPAKGNG